jgi:hypothetical protein
MAYIVAMEIQAQGKTCRIRIANNRDMLAVRTLTCRFNSKQRKHLYIFFLDMLYIFF